MNIKERLDILNSMDVIEYDADGTTLYYLLVENTIENQQKLIAIGVPQDEIDGMTSDDQESIDISGFGFSHGNAKWYHPDLGGWIDFIPSE